MKRETTFSRISKKFNRAFYGGGTDCERMQAAYDFADYYQAFGQPQMSAYMEAIGDFYFEKFREKGCG
jgi:hypothetical protein